jgi:acyl-CoA synthetase (AMP-forming)/AMP-acid ligase II
VNTSDYLLAIGRPDDVVLIEAEGPVTYGELSTACRQLAAALAALDLPPGSRVGLLGTNSLFWAAAYLATMKLGHVVVPFSDKLTPAEVARQSAWVGCAAVFMDRRHHRGFLGAFCEQVPVIADTALQPAAAEYWPDATVTDPDSDAALMFTSGTTASPKAVRITHRNIQANTDSIIEYLALRRDDRMLVILPFFYCFGASLLHTHLRVGASLALCNTFVFPETAVDILERERCTGFAGVPSSFQLLLRISTFGARDLPALRLVQQAGGNLPPVLVEELLAAQPNTELFIMYGQTEATARLSYLPPDQVLEKVGSIGRGMPGVELTVVDEAGHPVGQGMTGEIVARGANVSPGYWNDPDATARKFVEGELRTGDLAFADEDGYLYVVDRLDDFIKSWGHRISAQEVEACVLEMPGLVSAVALGIPDLEAGESIALVATVHPGATVSVDEVLAFARSRLAKHMVPRVVHLVPSIPLTASGKVDRPGLRTLVKALTRVG